MRQYIQPAVFYWAGVSLGVAVHWGLMTLAIVWIVVGLVLALFQVFDEQRKLSDGVSPQQVSKDLERTSAYLSWATKRETKS